jgi:putative ABC transport system permease protein
MSFTVSRRTREIGIRVALGSTPRWIVAAIFRQPLRQVALGILAGGVLLTVLMFAAAGSLSAKQVMLIAVYVVAMMGVCMLACILPTLRALRVEPTEALRAEG